MTGTKSFGAASGSTWPPGKTCRVACGISPASRRALTNGTIASSFQAKIRHGWRIIQRNGRLAQQATAAIW